MLILRKEAEEDVANAHDWYESQRENLGGAFVSEVGRSFELIEENPGSFPVVHKSIRRALCKKFPYAIYFFQRQSVLVVLAVMHQRRRPVTWQRRA